MIDFLNGLQIALQVTSLVLLAIVIVYLRYIRRKIKEEAAYYEELIQRTAEAVGEDEMDLFGDM